MWAKIGVNSFGGPAGQIAVIHDDLVERRRGAATVAALLSLVPVRGLVAYLGTENVLAQQAVDRYSWISAGEMVTGFGLAETTPGRW